MLATVRSLLIADPTISGLVGTNVFVAFATQEVEGPYIILDELAQSPNDTKDKQSVADSYMFGVTAIDIQFATVETLLRAARTVLDGYNDVDFRGISYAGLMEHYDGTQDKHVKTNSYKSLIEVP